VPSVRIVSSIAMLDKAAWDACFSGSLETYDYLRAVEDSGLPGFEWRYAIVEEGDQIVAAAPGFLTDYNLDTTLSGSGKQLAAYVRRFLPGALRIRLGCIGSPCTETVTAGFASGLSATRSGNHLRLLTKSFEAEYIRSGAGLLAIKDTPAHQSTIWRDYTSSLGYRPIAGLPIAMLNTNFTRFEDYLQSLTSATRKDMKRKMRSLSQVRIEHRIDIRDVLNRMYDLYLATLQRAELQFEELTPDYFTNVLSAMNGRAFCTLYFEGETLIGFNLLLENEDTLLDKFFCMDAGRGRALSLYFLSWLENVRYCIERKIPRYQAGQAAHELKLRLGCILEPTQMHFKHRNILVSKVLQLAAPLFVSNPAFMATAT
jgi:uncharacterized protein